MPTILTDKAIEGGTYGIQVKFLERATPEAAPTPFTPNSGLKWSLRDRFGAVVNSKKDQPIASAETIVIVLTEEDLALVGGPTHRYVTVEGTYNGILGNNLALVGEVKFPIINLVGQPNT